MIALAINNVQATVRTTQSRCQPFSLAAMSLLSRRLFRFQRKLVCERRSPTHAVCEIETCSSFAIREVYTGAAYRPMLDTPRIGT